MASLLGVFAARDSRCHSAPAFSRRVGLSAIFLVRYRDVRADVERRLKLCAVAGQMEVERIAVEIGLKVDFEREAAARLAEHMALLPPFPPPTGTLTHPVVLLKN